MAASRSRSCSSCRQPREASYKYTTTIRFSGTYTSDEYDAGTVVSPRPVEDDVHGARPAARDHGQARRDRAVPVGPHVGPPVDRPVGLPDHVRHRQADVHRPRRPPAGTRVGDAEAARLAGLARLRVVGRVDRPALHRRRPRATAASRPRPSGRAATTTRPAPRRMATRFGVSLRVPLSSLMRGRSVARRLIVHKVQSRPARRHRHEVAPGRHLPDHPVPHRLSPPAAVRSPIGIRRSGCPLLSYGG